MVMVISTTIMTTILLLSMVVSIQALSCAYTADVFSLNNMLHAAEVVAMVHIVKDITPKPKPIVPQQVQVNMGNDTHPIYVTQFILPPQIAGWTEPKYYTATVKDVLSGNNYQTGKIVVKAGIPCGVGQLKEKTVYLLFGAIHNEEVQGYVGEIPVFLPHGMPYQQKPIVEYSRSDSQKIRAFAEGARTCEPQDCSPSMALDPIQTICPDRMTTSGSSTVCAYQNGSCNYNITTISCPSCTTDQDCKDGLICNADGLCAIP